MSSEQVLNEELAKIFDAYTTFDSLVRVEGVRAVLDDLRHFYPWCYEALEEEFKRRQKMKELGALLVNPV